MRELSLLFLLIGCFSCSKNKSTGPKYSAAANIDSINAARTKYNDSIKILNTKNHFRDLSGSHKLTHSSITSFGAVNFKNTGRDLYQVSGGAKSGKNYVEIEGQIKMVSEKYLNFTGKVTQRIIENDGGKTDVRSKKTSFVRTGNSPYWRFQNRVNNSGFADNIDIYR
ncbi:hypothetical protein [Kaistella palustris]|uniref:hypothetical protein n=1 Tax=Kaistella palustris TaxID=493376 RepID=UPI00041FDCA5|nr:hypothetical protein [Kaistella palustris]